MLLLFLIHRPYLGHNESFRVRNNAIGCFTARETSKFPRIRISILNSMRDGTDSGGSMHDWN